MSRRKLHWLLITGMWAFPSSMVLTHFVHFQGDVGDFYRGLLTGVAIGLMGLGVLFQSRPSARW
jgi:hypothetical protein